MLSILYEFTQQYNVSRLRHLDRIKHIPRDKMVLCGSAFFVAAGYIDKNDDLDIVVPKSILEKYIKPDPDYKIKIVDGDEVYESKDGNLEFGYEFSVLGLDFESLFPQSVEIQGYYFMGPEILWKFYKKMNRPKDQPKLKILRKLLNKR